MIKLKGDTLKGIRTSAAKIPVVGIGTSFFMKCLISAVSLCEQQSAMLDSPQLHVLGTTLFDNREDLCSFGGYPPLVSPIISPTRPIYRSH